MLTRLLSALRLIRVWFCPAFQIPKFLVTSRPTSTSSIDSGWFPLRTACCGHLSYTLTVATISSRLTLAEAPYLTGSSQKMLHSQARGSRSDRRFIQKLWNSRNGQGRRGCRRHAGSRGIVRALNLKRVRAASRFLNKYLKAPRDSRNDPIAPEKFSFLILMLIEKKSISSERP